MASSPEPTKGQPDARWEIQPLRELEADVPLAYRVEAVADHQIAVQVSMGDVVLIDPEGIVRNGSGTAIFRLARLPGRSPDAA